jgi:hypothetical protein
MPFPRMLIREARTEIVLDISLTRITSNVMQSLLALDVLELVSHVDRITMCDFIYITLQSMPKGDYGRKDRGRGA